MRERTALYRHWHKGNDTLLYVGIAANPFNRLSQHALCSFWLQDVGRIDIEWFASREEALEAEQRAIETEHPKFNLQFARRGGDVRVHPGSCELPWAVGHVNSGCLNGWYRGRDDAQDVLEMFRSEYQQDTFVLIYEPFEKSGAGRKGSVKRLQLANFSKWRRAENGKLVVVLRDGREFGG